MGCDLTYMPVQKSTGIVDVEELKSIMRPDTLMVSVCHVNGEIGVVQPLKEIGEICRQNKTFFHVDGAQAFGKVPIDVNQMKIDLLSISGHKIYGPKGIGALYVRRKPRVRMVPQISGGGQEKGLRSGTLAPHLCVGLGEAARLASEEMESDREYILNLKNKMFNALQESLGGIGINGDPDARYQGNLNINIRGINGDHLM